jgi:hypothetical protein
LNTTKVTHSVPYVAEIKRLIGGRIYNYSLEGQISHETCKTQCLVEATTVRNILIVG